MIERATSCLNAGVRQPESRRCVQRAFGSKRTLHSAFWHHHGANNFELPPFTLASTSNAAAPGSNASPSHRRGKSRARPFITCPSAESGVFLDFLYPPQALAYLHRADLRSTPVVSPRDRWEYRHTRRVQEGRLQAARGYASKSFSRGLGPVAEDDKKEQSDGNAKPAAPAPGSLEQRSNRNPSEEEGLSEGEILQRKQQGIGDAYDLVDEDAFGDIGFGSFPKSERKIAGSSGQGSRWNIDDEAEFGEDDFSTGQQQAVGDTGEAEGADAFSGIDLDSFGPKKLSKKEKRFLKEEKKREKKKKRRAVLEYESDEPWDGEPDTFSELATEDRDTPTGAQDGLDQPSASDGAAKSEELMPDVPPEIHEQELPPGYDLSMLRELRRVVARRPTPAPAEGDALLVEDTTEDNLNKAMELFNELNKQSKPSATFTGLTDALLNWLAEHKKVEADRRFVTVWNSAPSRSRGAKPFENAFVIFRKQEQPLKPLFDAMFEASPLLTELHASAFKSAFVVDDWDSAFQIHTAAMALRSPSERDEAEFTIFRCCEGSMNEEDRRKIVRVTNWARELPGPTLAIKSLELNAWERDNPSRNAFASSVCQFVAAEVTQRLLGAALYLQRDDPRLDRHRSTHKSRRNALVFQSRRIEASVTFAGDLMNFVLLASPEQVGTSFAERMMTAMLSLSAKKEDIITYRVAASFYRSYRGTPGAYPPRDLLLLLLERSIRWEKNSARSEDNLLPLDTIIYDWERLHQKLSSKAYCLIIKHYADIGGSDLVTRWYDAFKRTYTDFKIHAAATWYLVHVHVRSANVAGADKAFREIARDRARYKLDPDRRCWTALINTYARANDAEGAMDAVQGMNEAAERDARQTPNSYVYHIVCNLLARKGDVENVRKMLKQYDARANAKRTTPLVGSEILALIEDDRLAEAKEVLVNSVEQEKLGEIIGSHTLNFNQVLTALAVARDLPGAVSLYKDMKNGQVPPDSSTYAAIILALSGTRHDDAAFAVIRYQMPKEGFMPTALHYGIVMDGYLHIKEYEKVIWAHGYMQRMNVKQSKKTEEAYLAARSLLEKATAERNAARTARSMRRGREPPSSKHKSSGPQDSVGYRPSTAAPSPAEIELDDGEFPEPGTQPVKSEVDLAQAAEPSEEDALSMESKRTAADEGHPTDIQPQDDETSRPKRKNRTERVPPELEAAKVYGPPTQNTLRRLRTKERKLEAQLLDEYLIDTLKDFEDILPFAQGESPGNTTSQIKDDALSAKQYLDHVLTVYGAERTLDAVRDLFDRYFTRGVDPPIAILTYLMRTLDSLKQYKEVGTCWALAKEQADRMFAPITLPDMRSSVPDPAIASDGSALSIQAPKPSKKADKQLEITPSSTFGRRLMLSRPALFYIKTLVATNRMSDAIDLVTSLNVEGYSLDNMTWNSFIQHLCTADPPFALLAFQLTERFLIPNFPGWENVFWAKVNIQDQRSGLQHIKARYIAPDHLLPQYQTIIFLSHALLTLRYHESQGMQYLEAEHLQVGGVNLARYVGRLKQIRENAPRTLYAVQCLPLLDDEWQRQLRHEEGTDGNLFAPLSERRKSKETEEDDVGRG